MNREFGVLYSATQKRFIEEACRSAASVKEVMPDIPIALFVNDTSLVPQRLFDSVELIKNPTYSFADKSPGLINTPFQKTLYLDGDTLIIAPCYELSVLLDRFDLAFAHDPWRRKGKYDIPEVPKAFPEFNGGVLLYKKVGSVLDLFRVWSELYKQHLRFWGEQYRRQGREKDFLADPPTDQPALRKAVYESSVKFTILPSEYNLRTQTPYFVGGHARVKILHGREPNLSKVKSIVNNYGEVHNPYVDDPWKKV